MYDVLRQATVSLRSMVVDICAALQLPPYHFYSLICPNVCPNVKILPGVQVIFSNNFERFPK